MAAGSIFIYLFIVPRFEQLFQDALGPDHPLPGITNFFIAARIPLALVAIIGSISGIFAYWQRYRSVIWILNLGALFLFLLIGVTVIALSMPMKSLTSASPMRGLARSASRH
jgi:type II secretory pathway component PulF